MPYKNVVTPFKKLYPAGFNGEEVVQTEPIGGIRVEWGKNDTVITVLSCHMTDGMPETSFAVRAYLNRETVNELIKTLREARDGAFGKDQ